MSQAGTPPATPGETPVSTPANPRDPSEQVEPQSPSSETDSGRRRRPAHNPATEDDIQPAEGEDLRDRRQLLDPMDEIISAPPQLERSCLLPERLCEEAQALRRLVLVWRRLLGLAPCAPPPALPCHEPPDPPLPRRVWPALWLPLFLLLVMVSLGLQWARCQHEYMGRMRPPVPHNATTPREPVCAHSFVWTFLLPRLLYALGYIAVFVCWFCLRRADFAEVVARVCDTVTEQAQYMEVSLLFRHHCRQDRCVIATAFVVVTVLSAVSALAGEGIVSTPHRAARTHRGSIVVASEVVGFLVTLVIDNVMFLVLVTSSLSVKYLHLVMLKVSNHLAAVSDQAHITFDSYVRPHYKLGCELMQQSQAVTSAAVLLVLLRICSGVTNVVLDSTAAEPHGAAARSAGTLPIVLVFAATLFNHLRLCCILTSRGLAHHWRHISTGPDFTTGGTPDTDEASDDAVPLAASTSAPAGAARPKWAAALRQCPAITGRLFGLAVRPWMFVLLVMTIAAYCGGYYALERYWPLI